MTGTYSCLQKQAFTSAGFSLVPLRDQDKYDIMRWRNEQIYHLRQSKPLTKEDQDHYFANIVSKLFDQQQPSQILFSYLENDVCIGYGGLVHINWIDKNAEISFIIDTSLEKDFFEFHWINYLGLIEQLAFSALNLHKIFTYAFADVRPQLSGILEKAGYKEDARLREHCLFSGKFIDVVIHAKMNKLLTHRRATPEDMELYFTWTNDELVRKQSFQTAAIKLEDHQPWFLKKIADQNCIMLVFENDAKDAVGQVRIEKQVHAKGFVIGVSVAENFRNKGYASRMISDASNYFFSIYPAEKIYAYIKKSNPGSIKAFEKAGYDFFDEMNIEGVASVSYIKTKNE